MVYFSYWLQLSNMAVGTVRLNKFKICWHLSLASRPVNKTLAAVAEFVQIHMVYFANQFILKKYSNIKPYQNNNKQTKPNKKHVSLNKTVMYFHGICVWTNDNYSGIPLRVLCIKLLFPGWKTFTVNMITNMTEHDRWAHCNQKLVHINCDRREKPLKIYYPYPV